MIYKIFSWAVLTNSAVCGKMVFVFRFFASLGGVGAFSALREQTGGASLRRGALKVAHRISERTALLVFLKVQGSELFGLWISKKAALIRIRRVAHVTGGNEG